jgi:hypothetical protein
VQFRGNKKSYLNFEIYEYLTSNDPALNSARFGVAILGVAVSNR